MATQRRIPDAKRYWPKVDKRGANECWPWLGSVLNTGGYGQFYLHDARTKSGIRSYAAHRYGYELANGVIPAGRQVRHTCDNKICQNPKHLTLSSGIGSDPAKTTYCSRGHKYTPENTLIHPKTGAKLCKACNRDRQREYRERNTMATVRTALPRRPVHMAY